MMWAAMKIMWFHGARLREEIGENTDATSRSRKMKEVPHLGRREGTSQRTYCSIEKNYEESELKSGSLGRMAWAPNRRPMIVRVQSAQKRGCSSQGLP